jgi:RNA polymerase sigma-70 factor, ECF subfamily
MAVPEPVEAALNAFRKSEPETVEAGELVRRAQKGDLSATRALYLENHAQIYRFIWSRVQNPALADDLTGEVFLRMVASLPAYQDRAYPFRAWLYRIARNLLIDHFRRHQNQVFVPLESVAEELPGGQTPEKMMELKLTIERVKQALEDLTPEQREVVELRFLAGLSLNEVALTVDKTVSAVKSLQSRGLITLRAKLGQ